MAYTEDTGTDIWKKIMTVIVDSPLHPAPPGGEIIPTALQVTSPTNGYLVDEETLWHSLLIPPHATQVQLTAHFRDESMPLRTMIPLLRNLVPPPASPAECHSDSISPTQQWFHNDFANEARQDLRGGTETVDQATQAAGWVSFLESITGPSADYSEALQMVRRVKNEQQPQEIVTVRKNLHHAGWNALAQWSSLRLVLLALEYEVDT